MNKVVKLMNRRGFLKGLGALTGAAAISAACGYRFLWALESRRNYAERDFSVNDDTSLRERAFRKGLIYGASTASSLLTTDRVFAAHFAQECGILVPESELKWAALRPASDRFNFVPADKLLNIALKNNIQFRGHTLVWHNALPNWFQNTLTSQNAEQILREHISTVAGHYAGKMHSWDVVNEAIAPWEGLPDCMRNSPWLKLLGPKYIDIAFRAAAEADSKAILVYNQNHLEYNSRDNEECRIATLNLLRRLKSAGTPVHALGIQAHLNVSEGTLNPKVLRAFLQEVASLGLKIIITELDVSDQNLPYDVEIRDRIVAGIYDDFLSIVLDEPAVIAVLTWGLSDKYTWLSDYKPRYDKTAVRSLPLDEKCKRKLAWNAMARAFDRAPKRKPYVFRSSNPYAPISGSPFLMA